MAAITTFDTLNTLSARKARPRAGARRAVYPPLLAWVGCALWYASGASWAQAAAPKAPAAAATSTASAEAAASGDWTLSADGSLVIDQRAHLVWPRCIEGLQWNGRSCAGKALLLDRAEATVLGHQRWKDLGLDWRLPRVMELQRLIDKTQTPQGLPRALFPAAPAEWHWTSTSNVESTRANPYNYGSVMRSGAGDGGGRQLGMVKGWAVHLGSGEARGDVARSSKLPVRLVRSLTAQDLAADKPAAPK
jgi:hypothetical protein